MAVKIEKRTNHYSSFTGVDFLNQEVSYQRSPDSINMYKSYDGGNEIKTRPGLEKILDITGVIYGLYFFETSNETKVIVHVGTTLLKWNNYPNQPSEPTDKTILHSSMNAQKSIFFIFNDKLYILDGKNYLVYDGNACSDASTEAYIPTTTVGRNPTGGGTFYQGVNVLSPWRYNFFVADGTSTEYYLDVYGLDNESSIVEVTVDGNTLEEGQDKDYTVDKIEGKIIFKTAPPKPISLGENNVVIKCKKTISGYADRIKKCTLLTDFDNRVFFSGNPTYPNTLFHSHLEDPTYIMDLYYYPEGLDLGAIKTLITGNNLLWVIKETGQGNASVYYHVPTIDYQFGKIYPSRKGKVSVGCLSEGINFQDDIVFISKEGLMGMRGDIESEQFLVNRSSLINPKFTNETDYDKTKLEVWNGYLVCLVNGKIYLADSRQKHETIDGFGYEWYYWDNIGITLNKYEKATMIKSYKDDLFIGGDSFLCKLSKEVKNIYSCWTTAIDNFGYHNRQKNTNKRGGLAKIKGDCALLVKTGERFEPIQSYSRTYLDYVVFKIKKKKWIDIQLKFESNTWFELHNATMEAFITGYKRR